MTYSTPAVAIDLTWQGTTPATNTPMNQSANWSPSQVPTTGDNLIFPGSGFSFSVLNDIGTLEVGNLTITGAYEFVGSSFTIPSGTPSLTYGGSGSNINLGGLTLQSGATWQIQSNASGNTITSAISGSGGLDLQGGLLILRGVNTYTGQTTLGTGANLRAESTQAFGLGSNVTIGNGSFLDLNNFNNKIGNLSGTAASSVTLGSATLTITNSGTNTYSGTITGTSAGITLDAASTGSLTLSGNNSYSSSTTPGTTTVEGGTLIAGSSTAFGSNSALTVGTGATLDLNNFNQTFNTLSGAGSILLGSGTITFAQGGTYTGSISGTGNLIASAGNLTLGTNSYTGSTTIEGGSNLTLNSMGSTSSLIFQSGGGTLTAAGALDSSIPIQFNGPAAVDTNTFSFNFSGPISGAQNFTKTGTGTLTLSNAGNNFSGATTVSEGTLKAGSTSAFGSGVPMILGSGATLDLDSYNVSIGNLSGLFGSTVSLGSNTLTITNGESNTGYYGSITGTGGSLTLTNGTLNLLSTNTYTGATTIQGGSTLNTLNLGSSNALNFESGGGKIEFGSSTLPSTPITAPITLNAPGTISTNTYDITLSGDISGASQLTKLGPGTLTLIGTNTNNGPLSIQGGILNVNDSSLGSPTSITFVNFGSTLQASAPLTITQPITLSATGTFDTNGTTIDIHDPISGGQNFVKTGAGELTLLSAGNNYAGNTVIEGGTLIAGSTNYSSSSQQLVFAGDGTGIFQLASNFPSFTPDIILMASGTIDTNGFNMTASGVVAGLPAKIAPCAAPTPLTYSFTKAGAGTLTLSGDNIYQGKTFVTGGTLQAGVSSTATTGPFGVNSAVTLSNGTTLDVNNFDVNIGSLSGPSGSFVTLGSGTLNFTDGNDSTFSGIISGSGGIKNTAGTQILAGMNTYTGATTIDGGTLRAGSNSAFGIGSAVAINSGALDLQQTQNTVASLTMASGGTLQTSVTNTSTRGLLTVSGSAQLGGTLIVNAQPGFFMSETDTTTLLNALGGLTSQFTNTLFQNFPGEFVPQISYVGNEVILGAHKAVPSHTTGSHTEVSFTSVHQQHLYITRKCGQLRSRLFAANAASSGNEDVGVMSDNFESSTAATSTATASTKATASLGGSSSLQRRLATVQQPTSLSSRPTYSYCEQIADSQVYASSLYSTGSVESKGDQAGFNYDSVGGLIGFDRFFADQESGGWGAIAQYKRQNARIDNNGGSTKVDQVHGNLYATYIPFCDCPYFSVNGVAGVAYAWDKLERNAGPTQSLQAHARTHETLFDLLLQAEYLLSSENTSWIPCNAAISPWLGAGYIYNRIAGYQESGAGAFNLASSAQTAQSLVSSLGVRLLSLWDIGESTILGELDLGWQHQFANRGRSVFFTAFEVNTSPATISTISAGKDTFLVGLDLTASLGGGWEIEGSANYHLNNMYHDLTFYLGLNKRF